MSAITKENRGDEGNREQVNAGIHIERLRRMTRDKVDKNDRLKAEGKHCESDGEELAAI